MSSYFKNIVLLRHGETDEEQNLDHLTPINENGKRQAVAAGSVFDKHWLWGADIYCSTHLRCRQTFLAMCENEAFENARNRVLYDPNLREVAYGPDANYFDIQSELHCEARKKSKFYYRFKDGESPADAYTRACLFWDRSHRKAAQHQKRNLLVVSHGMMTRLLVMRFMRWTPDEYDRMENVKNCQPVQIVYDSVYGKWNLTGITMTQK